MSKQSCSCADSERRTEPGIDDGDREAATVSTADAREAYRDRPLPDALGTRARAAHRLDGVPDTAGDWADGLRDAMQERWEARPQGEPPDERAAGGREQLDGPPTVGDLCLAGGGRHRARWSDRTEQFHCTVDAMMVPFIVGEPATVTSASPRDGALVTVEIGDGEATVRPADAVLSLGAGAVEAGDGFDWDAAIDGLCAYGNAFPTRADYEAWADGVDAATTAVPLVEGVGLAADLVEGPSDL